jgi:uncharacterized protein (DUF305 family)
MAKLREAEGDEFDRLFLESMTEHHGSGVAAMELVPEKARRGELVSAAKKMTEQQAEEIRKMTAWHDRWFGKGS